MTKHLAFFICFSTIGQTVFAKDFPPLPVAEGVNDEIIVTYSGDIRCTGAIIGPKAVLVAASCIDPKNPVLRFYYQDKKYTAIAIENNEVIASSNDLAIAVVFDEIQGVKPISLLTSKMQTGIILRIFSYGCEATGENAETMDTLRFSDTSVIQTDTSNYIVQKNSSSSACFLEQRAPSISLAKDHRFVAGITDPNASYFTGQHRISRLDTIEARRLFQTVGSYQGIKLCGYNQICP